MHRIDRFDVMIMVQRDFLTGFGALALLSVGRRNRCGFLDLVLRPWGATASSFDRNERSGGSGGSDGRGGRQSAVV